MKKIGNFQRETSGSMDKNEASNQNAIKRGPNK